MKGYFLQTSENIIDDSIIKQKLLEEPEIKYKFD